MRILVTAGPTREAIDAVRYISNRSSGKMGYAVAAAALERGHEVVLVTGPVALARPRGARTVAVTTADEMLKAVRTHVAWCDVLVMAAAVADFKPMKAHPGKLKKDRMPQSLRLKPTVDILRAIKAAKGKRCFVGFAAETERLVPEARRKLKVKGLDLIVANDVRRPDSGFDVDTNRVTVLAADGRLEPWPLMTKKAVAGKLLDWIEAHR